MAALNLNKVILGGRLTADPELKTTPSGVSVCTFGLAVNRKYSKEGEQATDFINCVAWRVTAEVISRYFKKGSSLCIVGSIQARSYTDKDGNKRSATEVIVDEANFVDSKSENSASEVHNVSAVNGSSGYMPSAYGANLGVSAEFVELGSDEGLPF